MMVSEIKRLKVSASTTDMAIEPIKSPMPPGSSSTGMKPSTVVRVEAKSGTFR